MNLDTIPLEVDMYRKDNDEKNNKSIYCRYYVSVKMGLQLKRSQVVALFDIRDEMINDSKDFLDTVEATTIAQECVNLKQSRR